MQYSKYFKSGQKIILRALNPTAPGRFESLTSYFQDNGAAHFDLLLPYGAPEEENYPFAPEMPFEILSEALGVGVRLTGQFQKMVRNDLVRLAVNGDLQVFQRRTHRRLDVVAGLRYTKGKGTLRSFRDQWEKNIQILQKGGDAAKLSRFPRTPLNLSAGGIRFAIKPPVQVADLSLLLLELESGGPICTLAEVIWMEETEVEGRHTVGMRFLNILEADQKRIEDYIRDKASVLPEKGAEER